MKRIAGCMLTLLMIAVFASTALAAVKVGSAVPVEVKKFDYTLTPVDEPLPDWPNWVTVANTDGISNSNGHFKFGEEACVSDNGTIKVIKLDETKVLVEYTTLEKGGGTMAPNGTLFFLAKTEFSRLLAKHEKQVREEREKARKEAQRLQRMRAHVVSLLTNK